MKIVLDINPAGPGYAVFTARPVSKAIENGECYTGYSWFPTHAGEDIGYGPSKVFDDPKNFSSLAEKFGWIESTYYFDENSMEDYNRDIKQFLDSKIGTVIDDPGYFSGDKK